MRPRPLQLAGLLCLLLGLLAPRLAADDAPGSSPAAVLRADLVSGLRMALARLWRVDPQDLEVDLHGEGLLPAAAAAGATARWGNLPLEPTRRFHPRCEFLTNAASVATWVPLVQARLQRDVWIVDRAVPRDASLTASDLRRERVDVLALNTFPWEGDPTSGDWMAGDGLRPGAVLADRQVRRRPILMRGDTASARLVDGLLSVSFRVVAQENGAVGDRIRCRSTLNGSEFRARILDAKNVLLDR